MTDISGYCAGLLSLSACDGGTKSELETSETKEDREICIKN